ncbi:hypothetical protein STCU_12348 [Strigomonas culicis]|uniref:Uncharacterized protein n=1 Tax=Strigomonas culicis TaxID=28005 RepID=S9UX72_9TRYP|nr:hypothetical protein STCU_12348 [Strigomonas culicis]|eukprot:EPY15100.1 hypothetical protein STCU_12348 [Strigomonas culicis]
MLCEAPICRESEVASYDEDPRRRVPVQNAVEHLFTCAEVLNAEPPLTAISLWKKPLAAVALARRALARVASPGRFVGWDED